MSGLRCSEVTYMSTGVGRRGDSSVLLPRPRVRSTARLRQLQQVPQQRLPVGKRRLFVRYSCHYEGPVSLKRYT